MDSKLKYLVIQDYKKSLENLNEIISGKRPNWFVLKPHQYLTPTVITKEISFDREEGEFQHYNKICETLEKLLAGEKIRYLPEFRDAPAEIKQFLDRAA